VDHLGVLIGRSGGGAAAATARHYGRGPAEVTRRRAVSNVYKKVELVGSSRDGVDDAIRRAIVKAGDSIRNMDWFEVKEIRGWIQDGEPQHTQVTIQVGFRLEDE
jgi:flavin-binding protein dodecin